MVIAIAICLRFLLYLLIKSFKVGPFKLVPPPLACLAFEAVLFLGKPFRFLGQEPGGGSYLLCRGADSCHGERVAEE